MTHKCPKCGFEFENDEGYIPFTDHFVRLAENPNMIYVCDQCGKETTVAYARRNEFPISRVCYSFPRYTFMCEECMAKYYPDELS